jgi:hypothetical protein
MKLNHDYWSEKYQTETPGVFALVVTYDPAMYTQRREAARAKAARERSQAQAHVEAKPPLRQRDRSDV